MGVHLMHQLWDVWCFGLNILLLCINSIGVTETNFWRYEKLVGWRDMGKEKEMSSPPEAQECSKWRV